MTAPPVPVECPTPHAPSGALSGTTGYNAGAVRKGRVIVFTLGLAAVLSAVGLTVSILRSIRRETELIESIRQVLRGEIEAPVAGRKGLTALMTCKAMGPDALPLLPELLELYRRGGAHDEHWFYVIDAIRAIGEEESLKEVAGLIHQAKRHPPRLPKPLPVTRSNSPDGGGAPARSREKALEAWRERRERLDPKLVPR